MKLNIKNLFLFIEKKIIECSSNCFLFSIGFILLIILLFIIFFHGLQKIGIHLDSFTTNSLNSKYNNMYEGMKIYMFDENENEHNYSNNLVKMKEHIVSDMNELTNIINGSDELEYIIDDDSLTNYSKNPKNFAFYDLPKLNVHVDTLYSAIIVEPRKHSALEFVLKNFLENLDDQWTVVIIHGNLNNHFVKDIINKKLFLYKNRIRTINLEIDNLTISQYSEMFYNYKFYDYIPTETFLIFQTDSMILEENRKKIYDFIEYDYVGAPWIDGIYGPLGVGNGGLSLRKKSKMIKLLKYRKLASINKINTKYGEYLPEDRFFNGDYTTKYVNINKPSVQKAMSFSVESIYYDSPFGIHKCWYHLSYQNTNKIISKYPKIKILMNYNMNLENRRTFE